MAIVTSAYEVRAAQADGRSYVQELHTTNLGEVFVREYGPVPVVDYQEVANAHAIALAKQLAEDEFKAIVYGA
tara:strand:- start:122 stop:340 length:219 start_codon:yes stop_codon:yes gene_type:complete